MRLKEIQVSVKLSRNFDSYMVTKTFTVDEKESVNTSVLFDELKVEVEDYLDQSDFTDSLFE